MLYYLTCKIRLFDWIVRMRSFTVFQASVVGWLRLDSVNLRFVQEDSKLHIWGTTTSPSSWQRKPSYYRLLPSGQRQLAYILNDESQSLLCRSWRCCQCVWLDLWGHYYVGVSIVSGWFTTLSNMFVCKLIYILGLYEYNPVNMMLYFETRYDSQIYSGGSLFDLETSSSPTNVE